MTNTAFLNDLLDDLTHKDLTLLLNWLAVHQYQASRSNITKWRKLFLVTR